MQQQATDVELRLSELQTQIDRLSLALHQWHPSAEYAQQTEDRLTQLLERCGESLNRLAAIDERQTKAVSTLETRLIDWSFIEARLEQDSDQRIRQFEQIIEHEWEALRKLHEEPARQLREQAASLGETCIAAANLALRGFERAEARFAALEAGLQGRMNQLAGELQVAVTELRGAAAPRSASLPADVSPFPLESVMRIHDELRRSDNAVDGAPALPPGQTRDVRPAKAGLQLPEAAAGLSGRMEPLDRGVTADQEQPGLGTTPTEGLQWALRRPTVVGVLGVLAASVLIFWLQRQVETRLNEAAARVTAAERQAQTATQLASQQMAKTRDDAERQLAEARETALQAQIMSGVLAAPDLIRFNLAGGPGAPRAYAQVLWSRSRGLVLSASRVPAPRQGATYQLWLMTSGGPVSAGLFAPDSAGRATLATDNPPTVSRPVLNAAVTVEPSGGRPQPTGERILTRAQ